MCSEHLYYLQVGQNHPIQSLFYHKVLTTSCNLLSTERKKQWLSWVSNGCKCIRCFSLWSHDLLRALTAVAVQYHESIASLGKDQNSKCEVRFLLNTYCFPTIVMLNPHKSGTVCSTNGKTSFPDKAFSPSKYNSAESTILKNSLTFLFVIYSCFKTTFLNYSLFICFK